MGLDSNPEPTSRDEPVVLVDARNVVRSRWPNIPADRFVELARSWAVGERVRLLIVFDGTLRAESSPPPSWTSRRAL